MSEIKLETIINFLFNSQTKATYGAVADVIGGVAQGVGESLGEKTPRNSWVVNSATEMPTDYTAEQIDPAVHAINRIVRSGEELLDAMQSRENF